MIEANANLYLYENEYIWVFFIINLGHATEVKWVMIYLKGFEA